MKNKYNDCTRLHRYIGTFTHIGRILNIGGAFMGAGSFVMFLPQLLVGPYELGQKPVENCDYLCKASKESNPARKLYIYS